MSISKTDELRKFLFDVSAVVPIYDDHKPSVRMPISLSKKKIEKIEDKDLLSLTVSRSMYMSGSASDDSINYISTDITDNQGLEPQEFNKILEKFYPDIRLKEYLGLRDLLLKFKEVDEHGYYGSFTVNIHATVNLSELFQFLKEKNRLTLVIPLNENDVIIPKKSNVDTPAKETSSKKKKKSHP